MLRPEFTERLAARLRQGECINLQGHHGMGRRETLRDLQQLLPDIQIVKANLRHYPDRFAAMFHDLMGQSGSANIDSFSAWLDHLEKGNGFYLIILHNFDELQFGSTSGYDMEFMQALNSIQNYSNIALLTVTVELPPEWRLNSETLRLPPLPT